MTEHRLLPEYDVVVIGAGFGGLSAARDLQKAGKRVLLVEARDRIGGRTWTAEDDSGLNLEMGVVWVHWVQPHVFAESQRYGLNEFDTTVPHQRDGRVFIKRFPGEAGHFEDNPIQEPSAEEPEGITFERFLDMDGQGDKSVVAFPFDTFASIKKNPLFSEADQLSITWAPNGQTSLRDIPMRNVVGLTSKYHPKLLGHPDTTHLS